MNIEEPISTHGDCPCGDSKECYSLWANGSGFCHSCDNEKVPKVTKEVTPTEVVTPKGLTTKVVPYRGMSIKAVEKYKVRTQFTAKGDEYARLYEYPHATKKRILPKDFRDNKGFTPDHLFGMDLFNSSSSKSITIVEGEDDAPAAWEMLGGYEPVVALPGAGTVKRGGALLKNCEEYLRGFSQIILAMEDDASGKQAAERLSAVFPGKCYRVKLTKHKHAMEYLEAGDRVDFKQAWLNKEKYVPDFDISTPDAYLKLLRTSEDDCFIPSGIDAYDREHLGLFQGHVTLFQAPEGVGKTELFHFFEHHLLKNHPDVPFASLHLEESEKRTMLSWVSYDLGKNVTRKDLITDMKEVENSITNLTKYENAHLFSLTTDEDPMVLLDRISYYAEIYGCKYVFIEPIQDLAQQGHSEPSDERFLSKIAVNLSRLAKEKKIGIVIIGHENDEGLISDCRKLSKQASVVVRLERDIDSTDPKIRNITTLRSKKNRPSSFVGLAGRLEFNPDTFILTEYDGEM